MSAFFDIRAQIRLWLVAIAALSLDLWTKAWAFERLGALEVREFIPSILTFRRSVNPGALFGMGKGLVPLFIAASVIALAFVVYLFACSSANRRSLHVALAFVLAGSMGNLHDRVFIQADRVEAPGQTPRICTIVENDPSSDVILVGLPLDGSHAAAIPREGTQVTRVGVVRDFLKIEPKVFGRDIWPWVFNLADSFLVAGVGLLMINLWMEHKTRAAEDDVDSACVPKV